MGMGRHTIILGAGAFARELWAWARQQEISVVAFFDDTNNTPRTLYSIPVVQEINAFKNCIFMLGVGDPGLKAKLTAKAIGAGLYESPPFLADSVVTGYQNDFGLGFIACPNTMITCDVSFGRQVTVNLSCTIGHDCQIGDFVTLSPGVNVSGNVTICDGAYIGTNASIREGVRIGRNAVVGMGAVVIRDVADGAKVAGNPAREIIKAKEMPPGLRVIREPKD